MVNLTTDVSLMEHFKNEVETACDKLGHPISDDTEFYVVDLLFRYTNTKTLTACQLKTKTKTFAELYLKSLEQNNDQRALTLKYIGDTTLFLTGFFSDCFQRSLVDIDYYASLGRASYQNLLDLLLARVIRWQFEKIFDELSKKFVLVMDILAEVAIPEESQKAVDLLRIYERWIRTHSQRDEKMLRKKGIIPLYTTELKALH